MRHLPALAVALALGIGIATASGRRGDSTPVLTVPGPDTTFDAAVLALGQQVFIGKAGGGLCFSCHGANAKGIKGLAPNLTDAKWLHGDGSFAALVSTIETGVPKPKEVPAPMPPKGGSPLTPEQLRAVAAYIYSLRPKP